MVFIWGHLEAFPTLASQKSRISFFHKTPHQAIYLCRGAPPTLAMCKTHRTENFRAPRLSWFSFGDICRPFQPSHLKNHEYHFFTKLPTKPSSYALGHRQPGPCAKPSKLKTFVHQEFHVIHLGTFVGLSNPHISKITNFIFSQNSPLSHLAMPWCTAKLGQVKTHRSQNFRAPRLSWYSFGDICRPFLPSHLKNHEFQFFTNPPSIHPDMPWCTDQLGHVKNPPNSKLSCTNPFMVFIWGHLSAFPTLTCEKSRISIFHKTPHQAI